MSKLKLITTETFGDLACNFYRNMNDDILLTREQIGQALEYSNPIKAIQKIHLKHSDRLEPLCLRIKGSSQIGGDLTKSEEQERVYYSERGIMEICRWSRQPKANEFMDWSWDIIEKYRHNELTPQIDLQPLFQVITTLTQSMAQMQQDVTSLKESSGKKTIPEKKYSRWKVNTFAKLNLLTDYANEHSDKNITLSDTLHITLNEMQDIYDIELSDYVSDYMMEYGLENKPFDLDVIQHYKNIREMYTLTVNSFMERFNLKLDQKDKYKNEDRDKMNVFNELMERKRMDK